MGREEMGHSGIVMESVAKRRTRREIVEEREEGMWGKRERVEVDEVCDVMRSEGRENAFESWVERVIRIRIVVVVVVVVDGVDGF
ncbi:hypothetical protein L195_g035392 [Trifolium pratense]|uniref:Uncharacterized protein n=1 Tax=Trifolium pratense TaxID=57577 RepID=A0A2K3LLJ5_TRIPR|nr:hypothetical protein L195_g035392 [Trifolium pratense]